ncbi:hypothetical protein CO006_01880 [Candidatus Roizmanbacteria bacterium CG_4_8_14_3_um_filter_35_14]|nr:MAG: hypothetical protein CO006_01880 [Candidatus Roizmanbacteria bacterium CG_4_8_14_3_um_filter_35_14]
MGKKMILLIFTIMILIGLGVVIFFTRQASNKVSNKVIINKLTPINTEPVKVALNKNNYPLYLVDGFIDKISTDSGGLTKLDVKVRLSKIFPDQKEKEIVKTVIVKNNAEFVLHNLTTNKDASMEASSLKVADNIAIWIVEPNTDIFNLDQFTATKIIKFQ